MTADLQHLITVGTACRRIGCGRRRLHRMLASFSPIDIGGVTFLDGRLVDAYVAGRPDLTGTCTAREAGRLLGCSGQHVAARLSLVPMVVDGPTGRQFRYPVEAVLALARERDAERRARDARTAKRKNAERDRQP